MSAHHTCCGRSIADCEQGSPSLPDTSTTTYGAYFFHHHLNGQNSSQNALAMVSGTHADD